jgi:RNA polymerase sigma-70 factor (ECF subfamily)
LDDVGLKNFEKLFKDHFAALCGFAMKYISDLDEARGVVHEVFVAVWEKYDSLPAGTNHRGYLYTAVRNRCLNYIRDHKKHVMLDRVPEHELMEENTTLETSELEKQIYSGIESLPEKCREIFELSRLEGLKYAQIAEKLGISVKTVEAQMSKALNVLRAHLKEFLTILFFIFST